MFYIASQPVRVLQWPAGSQPNTMRIGSCSPTMDTAPRISVTYLVSTANGDNEQVKHCKLSSFAKLHLFNVHTQKFLIRKTGEIKIFTKVDQIRDKPT